MQKFLCNGVLFNSFEEVENYCAANGFRITDTEKIKSVNLITVTKDDTKKYDWSYFPDKISGDFYK